MSEPFGPNPGDNATIDEATADYAARLKATDQSWARVAVERDEAVSLVRAILEAVCARDGVSVNSALGDEPARNYELALRLGIGHVFQLEERE